MSCTRAVRLGRAGVNRIFNDDVQATRPALALAAFFHMIATRTTNGRSPLVNERLMAAKAVVDVAR